MTEREISQDSSARPEQGDVGLPIGRIGHVTVSRLICGGNLVIGSAHGRDLIYLAPLMRRYFTDERIMQMWRLCEQYGINTMIGPVDSPYALGQDPTIRVYRRYRDELGGKIQWIAQTYPKSNDLTSSIQKAVDNGAVGAFIHGGIADQCIRYNQVDLLRRAIQFIKGRGLIAGCACHSLEVPVALEEAGVELDFYMKTLHSDNYWSATARADRPRNGLPPHDSVWCTEPDKTIEFMRTVWKSWIAFKVLAAGAIHPREGFRFAFQNGADFVNVGMFDFQVRENRVVARDIILEIMKKGRRRTWRG